MALQNPELRAFIAVARLGSFTRAATELNVSQPALSRRIRMVEQSLDATLFQRLRRGAQLTEAGRNFLPFAERALLTLRHGDEAVRGVEAGDRGRVSLAFLSTFGHPGLIAAIKRFRRTNRGVDLFLHTGLSPEVSDLVLRGDVDIGLRLRWDPDPALEGLVVGQETLQVVCSARHRLARRKTVAGADLTDETWIGFPVQRGESGMNRALMQYGLPNGGFMAIHSTELQIALVAENIGIGLLPQRTVAQAVRGGRLKVLKVAAIRNVMPVVLVRLKGSHHSVAAKRLWNLLSEALRPINR